ncbi:DUF2752 domain-containing protein [Myxococcota bacterium]|nr:DUF2752 domain-containing protein [Myxococcota bacterium]
MQRVVAALVAPVRWFEGLAPTLQDRLVGASLALPSGTVLAVARWLSPDPSGMGTHRQLGLGGCAMLTGTGVPCPMCGMTTTFSHMAHLQPVQALFNQPFGVALFLATALAFALGTSDLVQPRGRWRQAWTWVDQREGWIAGGLMLGLILGWAYKVGTATHFLSAVP